MPGGSFTLALGTGDTGNGGDVVITAGGTSADGSGVQEKGGSISLTSGYGSNDDSGSIVMVSPNAGLLGASGAISLATGTSSSGYSGGISFQTGAATGGQGGGISMSIGTGDTGSGSSFTISAGGTTAAAFGGSIAIKGGKQQRLLVVEVYQFHLLTPGLLVVVELSHYHLEPLVPVHLVRYPFQLVQPLADKGVPYRSLWVQVI